MANVSRRGFLTGIAAAGGVALGGPGLGRAVSSLSGSIARKLPDPASSGIDHVVVLMMENRSFDHLLGWVPGADGKQAGLSYRDKKGGVHATHSLAPDFQGCDFNDPDHSYEGGRTQFNHGRCDGFLRSGDNDEFAIGFYEKKDLPFLGEAATQWTTFDRYFCAF
ncbi:MAG: phospholipase, partial [Actinomycetota bacterium]|nr:phospholipase [Actinomycetota bacterium]